MGYLLKIPCRPLDHGKSTLQILLVAVLGLMVNAALERLSVV